MKELYNGAHVRSKKDGSVGEIVSIDTKTNSLVVRFTTETRCFGLRSFDSYFEVDDSLEVPPAPKRSSSRGTVIVSLVLVGLLCAVAIHSFLPSSDSTKTARQLRSDKCAKLTLQAADADPNPTFKKESDAYALCMASVGSNPPYTTPPTTSTISRPDPNSVPKLESGERLVGRWINEPIGCVTAIIKAANGYYVIVCATSTSTDSKNRLRETASRSGRKFVVENNDFGEYYVIAKDGSLLTYDSEGLIGTERRIQ